MARNCVDCPRANFWCNLVVVSLIVDPSPRELGSPAIPVPFTLPEAMFGRIQTSTQLCICWKSWITALPQIIDEGPIAIALRKGIGKAGFLQHRHARAGGLRCFPLA